MKDDKELAAVIARQIFEVGGDGPNHKVTRIQFLTGVYPHAETPGGGFSEGPLADFIEKVLNKHRSY
jgi:hypothetical protein